MKHVNYIIAFIVIVFSTNAVAKYTIMFSNNYPPYNFVNEQGELVGFNVDIIKEINNIYDADIIVESADWIKINELLKDGEIDAIGGDHYSGVIDNKFFYTRSTINTTHCFIYNNNKYSEFSLELFRSLKDPVVAIFKNDILMYYIRSLNPSAKFIYVDNYEDLVNMLDKEEVVAIFGQRVGSMYYANKLNKEYAEPLEYRTLERNMGFKVTTDSPELATFINNGLEVILANGKYQVIYDKWIKQYNSSNTTWRRYLKYILISALTIVSIILLLLAINRLLQIKVRRKTNDLQQQLAFNSKIMEELKEQKTRAEESDKMKSAFLANMSHEIRTPMNGILGFTDLLKSADYSPDKQAKFINIIKQSGNRMLSTINSIIDISKLESGLEEIQLTTVDIPNMINELFNFFSNESNSKKLELKVEEKENSLSVDFITDEYKLNSILTNLIKNAIKFTNKGEIIISYSITNEVAEFWIKDTGIGIAKDKQGSIFDHFVQANYSHSSGYEGSGLGLSISKGYVDLLKGEMTLKSELSNPSAGKSGGSTFYFKLPNALSKNIKIDNKIQQPLTVDKLSSKFKIIIAEDDTTSYEYLEVILQEIALKIIHAKDGLEVIDLMRYHNDTDIILMDIKMPKLNGFEAIKEIRKFNSEVKIIAQTSYVQKGYEDLLLDSGCDNYISKPIDKQKLYEVIYATVNT